MWRLAAMGVAAALCAVVLKKQTPELALALALAAGAMILASAMDCLGQAVDFLEELAQTAGLSPAVLSPVLKVVGISIVSRTAAEVCRDAKEGGLASSVETAAAVLALAACIPLAKTVLNMITGLV